MNIEAPLKFPAAGKVNFKLNPNGVKQETGPPQTTLCMKMSRVAKKGYSEIRKGLYSLKEKNYKLRVLSLLVDEVEFE